MVLMLPLLAPPGTQVKETTKDVTFLHNELFFAAAQKKYVYIYDKRGLEVHCLRDFVAPQVLEFLPHHFLLASVGEQGERLSRVLQCSKQWSLTCCPCSSTAQLAPLHKFAYELTQLLSPGSHPWHQ